MLGGGPEGSQAARRHTPQHQVDGPVLLVVGAEGKASGLRVA